LLENDFITHGFIAIGTPAHEPVVKTQVPVTLSHHYFLGHVSLPGRGGRPSRS